MGGMQTLAVTIRTLATNDLTKNNFNQNILKEFNIGILNGIIFAIISSLIVQVWFQDPQLSLIISISMVMTMIVAGLFGILVPVTLKKMNIDPAIASSVFVTTITDVIGFVSFLGVGAYFFLKLITFVATFPALVNSALLRCKFLDERARLFLS